MKRGRVRIVVRHHICGEYSWMLLAPDGKAIAHSVKYYRNKDELIGMLNKLIKAWSECFPIVEEE